MAKATRRKMVWHIPQWMDWYEPQENVRKKVDAQRYWMFRIRAYDMNSTAAIRARQEVLSEYGAETWVAYEDILCEAGKLDWEHRGYLLDSQCQPATIKMISGWINKPVKTVEKILRQLEKISIIAKVPLPDFSSGTVNRRKVKTSSDSAENPPPESGRTGPGSESDSLYKGKEVSRPTASKNEEKNTEEKGAAAAAPSRTAGQGQNPTPAEAGQQATGQAAKPKADEQAEHQEEAVSQATGASQADTAIPPTTTPPGKAGEPTETDGLGKYNPECFEFGKMIYRNLGFPWEIDSPEASREIASFASAWKKVQAYGLGKGCSSLWNDGLEQARKVRKKKERSVNNPMEKPGAIWNRSFDGLLKKRFKGS